jgi:DNA-binding NarL/FixJ family response regulator
MWEISKPIGHLIPDGSPHAMSTNSGIWAGRRERETLFLTTGPMNKQVAGRLGINEATLKMYGGQAMRKMEATSLAERAGMAEILGLHADDRRAQSAVSAGADHDSP